MGRLPLLLLLAFPLAVQGLFQQLGGDQQVLFDLPELRAGSSVRTVTYTPRQATYVARSAGSRHVTAPFERAFAPHAVGGRARKLSLEADVTHATNLVILDDPSGSFLDAERSGEARVFQAARLEGLQCVQNDISLSEGTGPRPNTDGQLRLLLVLALANESIVPHALQQHGQELAADLFGPGQLIAAGPQHRCSGSLHTVSRRVKALRSVTVGGSRRLADKMRPSEVKLELVLDTTHASITELFSDARVRFRSGALPSATQRFGGSSAGSSFPCKSGAVPRGQHTRTITLEHASTQSISPAAVSPAQRKHEHLSKVGGWGWIAGAVSKIFGAVKHLAQDAETVAKVAYTAGKFAVTGGLSCSQDVQLASLAFNYDIKSREYVNNFGIDIGSGLTLSCDGCYMFYEVDFVFNLDITNYDLVKFESYVEGDAGMGVQTNSTLKAGYSLSRSYPNVAEVSLPPFSFVIGGVYIRVNITMPIELGFNVEAALTGTMIGGFTAAGSVKLGTYFDTNTRTMNYTNDRQFSHSGSIQGLSAKAAITSIWYVQPTINIMVDYIGGPYIVIKPFIEANADLENPSNDCSSGLTVQLNLGTQISIGALIDIVFAKQEIYTWNSGATTIASMKKPVVSGCVVWSEPNSDAAALPSIPSYRLVPAEGKNLRGGSISPGVPKVGDVWHGVYNDNPGCDQPLGNMTLQMLGGDAIDGTAYWVASYNIDARNAAGPHPNGGVNDCIIQAQYESQRQIDWVFAPMLNQNGTEVLFLQCQYSPHIQATMFAAVFMRGAYSDYDVVQCMNYPRGCNPPTLYRD